MPLAEVVTRRSCALLHRWLLQGRCGRRTLQLGRSGHSTRGRVTSISARSPTEPATLLPARNAETVSRAVACNSYTADGPVVSPVAGFSAFLSGLAHHHGHPQPRHPADAGQRAGACFDHNAVSGFISPCLAGCGKTPLSFRDGPSGPGPEPRNTGQAIDFSSQCSWIPGSRATPAPRNDGMDLSPCLPEANGLMRPRHVVTCREGKAHGRD
jgi:hypothetical protein